MIETYKIEHMILEHNLVANPTKNKRCKGKPEADQMQEFDPFCMQKFDQCPIYLAQTTYLVTN
jgi:hypothetical protein